MQRLMATILGMAGFAFLAVGGVVVWIASAGGALGVTVGIALSASLFLAAFLLAGIGALLHAVLDVRDRLSGGRDA